MLESNTPKPTPPWFSLTNQAIGFCIGMAVCAAVMIYVPKNYPKISEILHGVYYMVFGAALLIFIVIVGFKPYVQRFLLNRAPNKVRGVIEDMQNVSDHVAIQLLNLLPTPPSEDIKTRAQAILPGLTNLLIWARLRNWWWQWILGIFVAIGGLMGTILLMNQNELLNNQNTLIQRQMSLEEASRRSSLVVLMSNIMDKVDDEIKEQRSELRDKGISKSAIDTMKFSLSKSLIGQITALSHSFKPYRYLEGDTLIKSPLSPERGQLLITLVQIPLDSSTRHQIYLYSTFQNADLKDAILIRANLSGLDLNDANFTKSYLIGANLHRTMLKRADLSHANLSNANLEAANMDGAVLKRTILFNANLLASSFVKADLLEAVLEKSYLRQSTLSGASLVRTNLSGADLSGADLLGDEFYDIPDADLSDADFSGANLEATMISSSQLSRSYSLKYCEGLPDSIRDVLVKGYPHLFTPQ